MSANPVPANDERLLALARARFPDLKPAEEKLVRAAAKGEFAFCGPSENHKDPTNDPAKATDKDTGWGPEREIRADLIRWLCVDRQARELVDPKGIQVLGAKITGPVDLQRVSSPFALALQRCRFMEDADLRRMEVPDLDLQGTWTRSIAADGARVRGYVFLRNGFRAEGEVRLLGAQIGGDLSCIGGTFSNPPIGGIEASGKALSADGIDVKGILYLRDGFHAEGEVRLLRAHIGGDLDCVGGRFTNPAKKGLATGGKALSADRAVVEGGVFLRNGFWAEGEVRLPGARIAGDLSCIGGIFTNPPKEGLRSSGNAIVADGIDVEGSVFLRNDFRAEGAVRFPVAQIRGTVNFSGAALHGEFVAEGAVVKGPLFWRGIAESSEASLNLTNASVDTLVDDRESWPALKNLSLDGFVYERISYGPKDAKSRLAWLGLQKDFRPQPYRQLAKVLREDGDNVGSRRILFEMERKRREKEDDGWIARAWSEILSLAIGYGYYPGRALGGLLVLVLVGLFFFWGGYYAGSVAPTDKDVYAGFKKGAPLPPHYEEFHAFIYSLENSFPLVKLGQAERWQPDPDPSWKGRAVKWVPAILCPVLSPRSLRIFRWGQVCFGWILATFFVAGVTGIVRKE